MEHVIHKFVLTEKTVDIALERDARVLYADRDSRTNNPAIWVLRPVDEARTVYRRRFHVVMTGERFEASAAWRSVGLVRLGEIIAHVFEDDAPGWGPAVDALARAFLDMYSSDELQRMLRRVTPSGLAALPAPAGITATEYARRAAVEVLARGAGKATIDAMRENRPRRIEEIDALKRVLLAEAT